MDNQHSAEINYVDHTDLLEDSEGYFRHPQDVVVGANSNPQDVVEKPLYGRQWFAKDTCLDMAWVCSDAYGDQAFATSKLREMSLCP